jgi:hypothetical protein
LFRSCPMHVRRVGLLPRFGWSHPHFARPLLPASRG